MLVLLLLKFFPEPFDASGVIDLCSMTRHANQFAHEPPAITTELTPLKNCLLLWFKTIKQLPESWSSVFCCAAPESEDC